MWVVLVILVRGALGNVLEGYWDTGTEWYKMYLFSCFVRGETEWHWNALLFNSQLQPIKKLDGVYQTGPNVLAAIIKGNCSIPLIPGQVDYQLVSGNSMSTTKGVTINFVPSMNVTEPFNLSLHNSDGLVIYEFWQLLPGSSTPWPTDLSLEGYFTSNRWVYLSWGNETAEVYIEEIGDSFQVLYTDLYMDLFDGVGFYMFHPYSGTISSSCEDLSLSWLGSWVIEVSPEIPSFGKMWFVCSSSGKLFSSFTDTYTVLETYDGYYVTEFITLNLNTLIGSIYYTTNTNDKGEIVFYARPNNNQFYGYINKDGQTFDVTGSRISSTAYTYLCSPFQKYAGLWIESEFSSWMSLCVEGKVVHGSYLGGSMVVNGFFYFDPEGMEAIYNWKLKLEVFNSIINETNIHILGMNFAVDNPPIVVRYGADIDDYRAPDVFARGELRSISNCSAIPSTWGIFSDKLFSSTVYLCTSNGNSVYGNLNNGSFEFTGTLSDLNVITGTISSSALKFVWTIDHEGITAEYIDINGVSMTVTMPRISNSVTLSQCRGFVSISTYVGSWLIDSNSNFLYFCQVSDTEIEGKMGTYFLTGIYKDEMLRGTYENYGTRGNWTAWTSREEKKIVLTIDNSQTLFGTRYSVRSTHFECGAWRSFWGMSFGSGDLSYLLGGCFSICFKAKTEFTIIFYTSEIYGNGTLDTLNGTLTGHLSNGWVFSLYIHGVDSVQTIVTNTNGDTFSVLYELCNNLPSSTSPNPSEYPDCLPRRFEPTLNLTAVPFKTDLNLTISNRRGGVDMSVDGNMAIMSLGNKTVIFSGHSWENEFEIPLLNYLDTNHDLYQYFGGNPSAITTTHAFVIDGPDVVVFQMKSSTIWEKIGKLELETCPDCQPLYLIKSLSVGYIVLEVTWYDPTRVPIQAITLYDISHGQANLKPFYVELTQSFVFSAAIHSSWLVYCTHRYTADNAIEVKVWYCSLSLSVPELSYCSNITLKTLSSNTEQLGFSIAVNSNYLFIGLPSSQNSAGAIYVYKLINNIWRLRETLTPPDSGFHQSFGRAMYAGEDDLVILKAIDNSQNPFSAALFVYSLSSSKNWVPKFKLASKDWPAFIPNLPAKKRQFTYFTFSDFREPALYWSMSNNGTLLITGPTLGSFTKTWISCAPGFWGSDCSMPCPCQQDSLCLNSILGYSCSCVPRTWGGNCENSCGDCNGSPCDDGSTGTGICLCNSSQYGPECLSCSCINGICSSGSNGTGCVCNEGFKGIHCETKIDNAMIISLSVIIPSVVLISIGILLYFLCGRKPIIDISDLPEEIRWYFDYDRILSEAGWNEVKGFMTKVVKEDKRYLKRLSTLLEQLDGGTIEWKSAYVIFNQTLQNNFLGYRSITLNRHNDAPGLFKRKYPQKEQRDWVMEQFNKLVGRYEWNTQLQLPILPVVHGTEYKVAKSICATGFAALSSLDAGFYGKGIYTTSSLLYALPYYAKKTKPSILICLSTPGNVYPVIEDSNDSSGWMGKTIKNGFQSHFVITAKSGRIVEDRNGPFYDEFVMPTESQLVPIYLVTMKKSSLDELYDQFKRKISLGFHHNPKLNIV